MEISHRWPLPPHANVITRMFWLCLLLYINSASKACLTPRLQYTHKTCMRTGHRRVCRLQQRFCMVTKRSCHATCLVLHLRIANTSLQHSYDHGHVPIPCANVHASCNRMVNSKSSEIAVCLFAPLPLPCTAVFSSLP